MNFERLKLWNSGKKVDPSEKMKCGRYHCRARVGLREFDFGFFCRDCFMEAPECSSDGCHHLVQVDKRMENGGVCRTCDFDYDGELEIYTESEFSRMELWAPGNINHLEIRNAADRFIREHGVYKPDPGKNWFPAERKIEAP